MPKETDNRLRDFQFSWDGGVDSQSVKTIQSQNYPDGLARNKLSWLINATVRGGSITPRTGWQPLVQNGTWAGLFQGATLYEPNFADPYIVMQVAGHIYAIHVESDNHITLLNPGPLLQPPLQEQAYFAQGLQFLVCQAGDLVTNPLFWDGTTMRRSNGFVAPNDPTNELPPARAMDYYQMRFWYAFGQSYGAGDIAINKTSGTAPYGYQDSILHVTENPVTRGGDSFIVPTNAGAIRALSHCANLDTALGESNLYVFTRNAVYACTAPVSRQDWSAADLNMSPLQKVALVGGGTYAHRSVTQVNGDLFFQSPPNGDIRSLQASIRYFNQWGNVPLSKNMERLLAFNDRSLLRFASGMRFDNRLWETALPFVTPAGVAFQGMSVLDFDLISTLDERKPPAWEGAYDGLYILQLLQGDFGGRERAFAIVWSTHNSQIEIWELTTDRRFDNGENRITYTVETPAYTFGDPMGFKALDTMTLWVDRIYGTVNFEAWYRPDQWPCWIPWKAWEKCAQKDCREDPEFPCDGTYPSAPFGESYAVPMTLPTPTNVCIPSTNRPATQGYQFQIKLVIKGWCRIRGIEVFAHPMKQVPFEGLVC